MKLITLANGQVTQVSDIDYPYLIQYKWNVNGGKTVPLPYVRSSTSNEEGKQTTIYMHRVITKCPRGYKVDHRDRDTLNNQRYNLRIATSLQNSLNRGVWGEIEYKGVDKPSRNRWRARITLKGEMEVLGYFSDPVEAAKAYDSRAYQLFGEFAWLNFEEDYPRSQLEVDVNELDIPFFEEGHNGQVHSPF